MLVAVVLFSSVPLVQAFCEEAASSEAKKPTDPVGLAIERELPRAKSIEGAMLAQKIDDMRFYEGRTFEPAWSGDGARAKDAKALMEGIEGASAHGLDPADYHLAAIQGLGEQLQSVDAFQRDLLLAKRDMLLTDAFLKLAQHLDEGVANPFYSGGNQRKPSSPTDRVAVLTGALASRSVKEALENLAPQTKEYANLQKALTWMQEEAARAQWPKVDDGKKIEPGDANPRVVQVRRRLEAEGFLKPAPAPVEKTRAEIAAEMQAPALGSAEEGYDEQLEAAVKDFQSRYGLEADGVVGKRTILMMNRTPAWRVCQIKINLDRLRALKHVITTERYALVNVPDFSLTISEGGKPVNSMKVIVGRLDRKSPLMSDMIRFIVFSPKWHVPRSIAVKDKLPKIKKDPSFIRRQGMKMYTVGETGIEEVDAETIDWSEVDASNFSYRIVQAAGDANALGRVKFMFPNRHDVYLHDTPTKNLFSHDQRTDSSGCIRISDPVWLAQYLLKDKEDWTRERIDASMRRATPLQEDISEHMPIHILYITAWADDAGIPVFRHDVYGYDAVVAKEICD
jgi:murein L,D-transpeptidase YcbB/YkuD